MGSGVEQFTDSYDIFHYTVLYLCAFSKQPLILEMRGSLKIIRSL